MDLRHDSRMVTDAEPDADPGRRRRRRRATAPQGSPSADGAPTGVPTQPAVPPDDGAPAKPPRRARGTERGVERGLRDIVGAGPSQLGISRALRARDVNRPTADDLAAAERDTVIVRRHWSPDGGR
jgi:hypothetical protein